MNINPKLALDVDNVTLTTTVPGLKSLFPRYAIVHLMSRREVNKDLPGYADGLPIVCQDGQRAEKDSQLLHLSYRTYSGSL